MLESMADLNSGAWAGRIISSPRLRTGENGLKVAYFLLACHRFIKDASTETGWREHADRFPVVAWGYLAERVSKANLVNGAYITISGRLQTYDYQRKLKTSDGVEFTIPTTGFEIALDTFNMVVLPSNPTKAKENSGGAEEPVAAAIPAKQHQERVISDEELEDNLPF